MNTVLAGILGMPLHLAVEIGDRESAGESEAAIALDPPDNVIGRGV